VLLEVCLRVRAEPVVPHPFMILPRLASPEGEGFPPSPELDTKHAS
jgi:hypothetical protein